MAASQCPKCSHWLGLRNDKGETVPLARCKSCQCYYPRQQGGCKWCGTQQPASHASSLVWGGIGVVIVAGVAWGAARVLGDSDAPVAPSRTATIAMTAAAEPVTPAPEAAPSLRPAAQPAAPTTAAPPASGVSVAPPPEPRAIPQQQNQSPAAAPRSTPVASATGTRPTLPDATNPADTVRPRPGDEGSARTWVNVRAATGRAAEVLGVITPDTRVRFGEARGAWIRVRTADLSGWADRRLFSVVR